MSIKPLLAGPSWIPVNASSSSSTLQWEDESSRFLAPIEFIRRQTGVDLTADLSVIKLSVPTLLQEMRSKYQDIFKQTSTSSTSSTPDLFDTHMYGFFLALVELLAKDNLQSLSFEYVDNTQGDKRVNDYYARKNLTDNDAFSLPTSLAKSSPTFVSPVFFWSTSAEMIPCMPQLIISQYQINNGASLTPASSFWSDNCDAQTTAYTLIQRQYTNKNDLSQVLQSLRNLCTKTNIQYRQQQGSNKSRFSSTPSPRNNKYHDVDDQKKNTSSSSSTVPFVYYDVDSFSSAGYYLFFRIKSPSHSSHSSTLPSSFGACLYTIDPPDVELAASYHWFHPLIQNKLRSVCFSIRSHSNFRPFTTVPPALMDVNHAQSLLSQYNSGISQYVVRLIRDKLDLSPLIWNDIFKNVLLYSALLLSTFAQEYYPRNVLQSAPFLKQLSSAPPSLTMIVLVGFPGSGKSYFSQQLLSAISALSSTSSPSSLVRVNQDEQGSRSSCESSARASLEQNKSVMVDRTNVDPVQRAHWIRMADQYRTQTRNVRKICIYLYTPLNVCKERILTRQNHPTLPADEKSLSILERFSRQTRLVLMTLTS